MLLRVSLTSLGPIYEIDTNTICKMNTINKINSRNKINTNINKQSRHVFVSMLFLLNLTHSQKIKTDIDFKKRSVLDLIYNLLYS